MPLSPSDVRTNRDLYLYIAELIKQRASPQRDLETYLRALLHLGRAHAGTSGVSVETFATMLSAAFDSDVPADLPDQRPSNTEEHAPYRSWESHLLLQITDLRSMAANGTLEDKFRYFGVDAPSGARWYNFDPLTYLECGAAGSIGGWQEGDDTGREYVPGPVAVLEEGKITAADPRDLVDPVVEISQMPWEDIEEFLWAGAFYE